MAEADGIFRLLDKLIEQTEFGNLEWTSQSPFEWSWRGTEAAIVLRSVDGDGDYPVRISILDKHGAVASSWIVLHTSTPEERAFDNRVRRLWEIVSSGRSAIASLLKDLDDLPPF